MILPVSSPALTDFARDGGLIFAVDIGGTHLRAAAIDSHGRFVSQLKQKTPQTENPQDIMNALTAALIQFQNDNISAHHSIRLMSVVVPGTVDVKTGVVVTAPNLSSLAGFELCAALTGALQLPVVLENDANGAAVGEMWQGAARGCRSIVCVTLGTGVGGGIILDGKLWRGANNSAGEIGHMCVEPFGGVACGCGSRGCLEVYASATAIVRMAREAKPRYPTSSLSAVEKFTAEEVYGAGAQGDQLAIEVFRRMGTYLGVGLANLVNIFNPEAIVIGGGLANAWDLFAETMHAEITNHAFPLPAAEVKIVPAECGDDAGLLGAARLGFGEAAEV